MGDDRRNEGGGAVVAVVVILGILGLLGALVVFGGAFFFLASHTSDVAIETQAMPVDTATVADPSDLDVVPLEKSDSDDKAEGSQELEIDGEGNIRLGGQQLSREELKASLTALKQSNNSLPMKLKVANSQAAAERSKEVTDTLAELGIAFEVK